MRRQVIRSVGWNRVLAVEALLGLATVAAARGASAPQALAHAAESTGVVAIENEACRIEFDARHGGLRRITNRRLADECLKGGDSAAMPFRIFADLAREFEIGTNDKFQLVFDDPASITRAVIQPGACRVAAERSGDSLILRYAADALVAELRVRLPEGGGVSDWALRITNAGTAPRQILACFPFLDGIRPGLEPARNLATAMDQAGLIVPAWERPGGVFGESNQMSMQWHAIWDPVSESGLGLIFMDADARPKRLVLAEPALALHYFPPVTLAPGAALDLPALRLLVYRGDWRPAARAYRAWHSLAYAHLEPPPWFRASNGNTGIHFRKGGTSVYTGQVALESFLDLPAAHLRAPVDNWEYAFYCRASMRMQDQPFTPHTDGDNVIREDLGGADAMRAGIAGVHRLGLHVTLYVDGYIIHESSDLARAGKGREWAVMHRDGTITGPYSHQGYYHMCPGCAGWQDHLADTVARLLRETDADAVRLDSLGFYYLACYNPAHHHESPFGYNDWLKTLLAKVGRAAIAVKPEVLLLTEGPADWFGPWIHGALTSRCPRELSPMRIALAASRNYVYATGALWGSLSGYPGGDCGGSDVDTLDWHWLCARFPAHEALVWGDPGDRDPPCSDPQIVTRCFAGDGYWAVVAARPACQDAIWPRGTSLASEHRPYVVTLPGLARQAVDAVLCDIESLTWTPLPLERASADVRVSLETNWALVIVRALGGPPLVSFDPLPGLAPGATTALHLTMLSPEAEPAAAGEVAIHAPGLIIHDEGAALPREATITVPADALPGNYAVSAAGLNVLGIKRFLVVE